MPKLSGPFTQFKNFDQINLGKILSKLKSHGDINVLENFFGNRIIYPQTVPVSATDMEIDLALFGEALISQPELILGKNNSIILTEDLTRRFSPLLNLLKSIINNLNLPPVAGIYFKKANTLNLVGSVFSPKVSIPKSTKVDLMINGQSLKILPGSFSILPFTERKLRLTINNSPEIEVSGGELGLVLDLTE